jgi:hypothetical protein
VVRATRHESTWNDFWLNEGFTTYVERRIMEALRGKDRVDVSWYLGRKDLDEAFAKAAPADTRLAIDAAADRDPDEIPSDAAYEKGALFLRTLEQTFGRTELDAFLRQRFDRLAFQSTDTRAFEADATSELLAAIRASCRRRRSRAGSTIPVCRARWRPPRRSASSSSRRSRRRTRARARRSHPRTGTPSNGSCSCGRFPRTSRSRG